MEATIRTDLLKAKLGLIQHVISNKNQLPILQHVYIEVIDEKRLLLKATDLEIGIQTEIPILNGVKGSTTVLSKPLYEIVSAVGEDTLSLSLEESVLRVKSKRSTSKFQTGNPEEYPNLLDNLGEELIKLDKQVISESIGRIVFASSLDSARANLTGVLFKFGKEGMTLVATDGYRLSLKNFDSYKIDKERQVIVSSRILRELMILDRGVDVFISKENNQIVFKSEETILLGRIIEGGFPDYQKIIPSDQSVRISFEREDLLRAVRSNTIFAREGANVIKLSLREEEIVASAQAQSLGENEVSVPAKLTGEPNEIAFNSRYLSEFLTNAGEEELIFEMSGPLNPGVFRIKKDPNFLHLIMPIRIQS